MDIPQNFPPVNHPPPSVFADEPTKKLIEEEGYIITQHKFEGVLKDKEIVVYTAKVILKSREGTPVVFNLKGGSGLSREDMIKMIKLVQSYASHISISEMGTLIAGKTFGINTDIPEAEGKVGLLAWDPSKKEMLYVTASSQWYGSAPGMTLRSATDKDKFYYFVFDLTDLAPMLPEEEKKLKNHLMRGLYTVVKGSASQMSGMLSSTLGITTQQDRIKRMDEAWKKIHGSDDLEARQKLEKDWLANAKEGVLAVKSDVTPLPTTRSEEPAERKEQLKAELGKRVFAFEAKRDQLKNMREAQAPNIAQSLLVPERLSPQRTEALAKYGASKLQQNLNSDLYLLRQQIQALQMELAAEELSPEGSAPSEVKELVGKYPNLPEQLKLTSEQQQDLIRQAQTEQNPETLQIIHQKLDLLEQIQRQRILFLEIALDEKARKGKSFFEGQAAIPRLNALHEQQELLQSDQPDFPLVQKQIQDNKVQPLEMEYGYVQNLREGKGVAMGSFEERLGISTTKLLEDYKIQRRSEEIIIESVNEVE
ncbi:MAG: phage tail tape measure protein [Verrucomicrobia bacterium]|nr:phage tail tape measure protein [Verrucomicrobiota bacterium]